MTEPNAPWYRRPGVLAVLAVGVLALGFGVGLLLSSDDDDGDRVGTTGTTAPVTTAAPAPTTAVPPTTVTPTTVVVDDVAACEGGDQVSCDRLDDDQLQAFCDEGNVDACQVLLARQGDGVPDGPNGEANGYGNGNGNGNRDEDDEDDD